MDVLKVVNTQTVSFAEADMVFAECPSCFTYTLNMINFLGALRVHKCSTCGCTIGIEGDSFPHLAHLPKKAAAA